MSLLLQGAGAAGPASVEVGAIAASYLATVVTARYIEQGLTTSAPCTLTAVGFYCEGQAGAQVLRLYAGDRTTLLATSAAVPDTITGLTRFAFPAPPALPAGTYVLVLDRGTSAPNGRFAATGFSHSGIVSGVGGAFYGDSSPPPTSLGTEFRNAVRLYA